MLGELEVSDEEDDGPPTPPKPSASSSLNLPESSSASSRTSSSSASSRTSSLKPLPTLAEAAEDRPSPFLARVIPTSPSLSSLTRSKTYAKGKGDALANILAMADDGSPPRVSALGPAIEPSAAVRFTPPRRKDSLHVAKGKGKERVLGALGIRPEQKSRTLHSTQTTERTKVVVTASFGAGVKGRMGEKENVGDRQRT